MPRLHISDTLSLILNRSTVPFAWLLAKYRLSVPVVAFLGLIASLLEGIGIGLLIPLIGLLLADSLPAGMPYPIAQLAVVTDNLARHVRVIILGGAVISFIGVKALVQGANQTFIAVLHGKLLKDIRIILAEKALGLDYAFFQKQDRSRLVQVIAGDGWYASETLRHLLAIVPAAMTLVVFAVLLLYLDWRLGMLALAGALLIQLILVWVARWQRRLSAQLTPLENAMMARILSIVSATRSIKIFGLERSELNAFSDNAELLRQNMTQRERVSAYVLPLSDLLVSLIFVTILLMSVILGVSLPVVTAFLVLLARAQPYSQAISRARIQIAAISGSAKQAEWLLHQQPLPASVSGNQPVPIIEKNIRFERVSYTYETSDPALHGVDCTLRAGAVTALIGKSGAGKTTFVNLLARLVEPSDGTLWHGEDRLSALVPEQWRKRIAIAGQDIDLIAGTISENITCGKIDASRDEIEEVAHAAGALQFIRTLPEGFDTQLDINATSLSGGQRQRIALARALVRRPDLLILDEATNAVDAFSESEFFKLVTGHRFFRTALIISHRRSTLAACDDGIVLEQGSVVEAGPLASLTYYSGMA